MSNLLVAGHRTTLVSVGIEHQNPCDIVCRGFGDAHPVHYWSILVIFTSFCCLFHTMKEGDQITCKLPYSFKIFIQ